MDALNSSDLNVNVKSSDHNVNSCIQSLTSLNVNGNVNDSKIVNSMSIVNANTSKKLMSIALNYIAHVWVTYNFLEINYKVTPFSNLDPILHRDSISFRLSHQPPLSGMCHFLCCKSVTFWRKSVTFVTFG